MTLHSDFFRNTWHLQIDIITDVEGIGIIGYARATSFSFSLTNQRIARPLMGFGLPRHDSKIAERLRHLTACGFE